MLKMSKRACFLLHAKLCRCYILAGPFRNMQFRYKNLQNIIN